MSLKDLIREFHGTEELSSAISQFIREREAKGFGREEGWHPSQFAGMCPRLAVLERLLVSPKKDQKIDAGMHRVFDVGHALHWWYQNKYFAKMGILWGKWECRFCGSFSWGLTPSECRGCGRENSEFTYKEVPLRARLDGCVLPVVGHVDGIIRFNNTWYVIEIKTMNSYGHGALDEPYLAHNLQAQIYSELIRQGMVHGVPSNIKIPYPSGIIFLYIGKNDSREKEFRVEIDEKVARLELQKPIIVETSISKGVLPDRKPECVSLLKEPAKKCSLCSYCFGNKTFSELSLIRN
jgi:hypothetical protein